MSEYGAVVEWYWQGKTEEHGEKPFPETLFPPQISHGLTSARTRPSAARSRLLTTWAIKRPQRCLVSAMTLDQWRQCQDVAWYWQIGTVQTDKQKRQVQTCLIHVSDRCEFPRKRKYSLSWLSVSKVALSCPVLTKWWAPRFTVTNCSCLRPNELIKIYNNNKNNNRK
jgi:hypothetical protein